VQASANIIKEITCCILSDLIALKQYLNNKSNSKKSTNNCRMNDQCFKELLNDQWEIVEIREEIKSFLEANENENTTYHNL
jgi:hypothetical protein